VCRAQPFADDLPLPLLQQGDLRHTAVAPGRDGMPRSCLVIDTEHLPMLRARDIPERRSTPSLVVRQCRRMRGRALLSADTWSVALAGCAEVSAHAVHLALAV
jgi:hypothetical protein